MNQKIANRIIKMVEGREAKDALSTVALALIHICLHLGVEKDHMMTSMSSQWDLYEKQMADRDDRNPRHH